MSLENEDPMVDDALKATNGQIEPEQSPAKPKDDDGRH